MRGKVIGINQCGCGYIMLVIDVPPYREQVHPLERLIEDLKTHDDSDSVAQRKMYEMLFKAMPEDEKSQGHHRVEVPITSKEFFELGIFLGNDVELSMKKVIKVGKTASLG